MNAITSFAALVVGLVFAYVVTRAYHRALERTGGREQLGRLLSALPSGVVYFWVIYLALSNYLETLPHVYFHSAPFLRFVEDGALPLTMACLALPFLVLIASPRRRSEQRNPGRDEPVD